MTAEIDYITLAQLKTTLQITDAAGVPISPFAGDQDLTSAISAASLEINGFCNRNFNKGAAHEIRYYDAQDPLELELDDLFSLDAGGLQTDDNGDGTFVSTWVAGTDFELVSVYHTSPYNAAADGWPYDTIRVRSNGNYRFPTRFTKCVKVTGTFGWNAVPAPVVDACYSLAARQYMLKRNAPLDVLPGGGEAGLIRLGGRIPNVMMALNRYRKHTFAVA